MKKLFFLIFCIYLTTSYAQFEPRIDIKGKKKSLQLTNLDVQIKVNGNYALSTYTMRFYNGYSRVLEGELKFPLAEGQSVVDFAMDVNGTMREAVVVEKEKGRVAFETTVRRKIDPALLEKTQGNNYKVRVYPIPPKSYKLIKITIEEELKPIKGVNKIALAFDGESSVNDFTMAIDVVGGELTEDEVINRKLKFKTERLKNHHIARIKKKNIPLSNIHCTFYSKVSKYPILTSSDLHFHVTTKVPERSAIKKAPKSITLLWDASMSMAKRNIEKELEFLDAYFDVYRNLKVKLITFSDAIIETKEFKVTNGRWKDLKEVLKNVKYDGATNYRLLNEVKLNKNTLLFTDGLGSFDDFKPLGTDLVFVNSIKKADYDAIHYLGGDANDIYINLNTITVNDGIKSIQYQPMYFMGYTANKNVYHIFHDLGIKADNQFSISGKLKRGTELELLFGDGEKVLEKQLISLEKDEYRDLAQRLWAKKKLETLIRKKKENKEKIINHAKEYKLLTDYTSLIVLDRLEDYLKYKIEPPAELQEDYKNRITQRLEREKREKERLLSRMNNVKNNASKIIKDWYSREFKVVKQPKKITFNNLTRVDDVLEVNDSIDQEEVVMMVTESDQVEAPASISYVNETTDDLEEVVVVGYGTVRKKEVTGAVVAVNSEVLEQTATNDIGSAIQGQIAGVRVTPSNGQPGTTQNIRIRGISSITSNFTPQDKVNTNVPKGVTSNLRSWDPNTPYIKELKKTESVEEAYAKYFELRKEYQKQPTFFMDVADYFIRKKAIDKGVRILTNLLEMDLNNYELLKAIAYKFDELAMYEMAVKVNQKIVELRSEDPQSYRDLALAYQAAGNYQKAFDLLYRVYSGEFLEHDEGHRFDGIEQISFVELSQLVGMYGDKLELTKEQLEEFKELPVDVRVVVDWNHNDTDLDLWVIDPNGEKCYYSHKKTKIGGRISNDMTAGFGPEEFLLKKAIKGDYTIKVKYYSDTKQKISGPTVLKLTLFTRYGTKQETKEVQTFRLTSKKEVLEVGNINF
ncbi:VIT domain-containing protein [Wenyingzhuangia sp. IMCC45574]